MIFHLMTENFIRLASSMKAKTLKSVTERPAKFSQMWCFARFGTICIILKTWKTPMEADINSPSWVFFKFFELYKWYQIAQRITNTFYSTLFLQVFLWIKNCVVFHSSKTAQKMEFSMKDFFSKCDQIRRILRILSHLLKKIIMENFIFCAVKIA